jgi:hypothetical protein
MDNLEIPRKPSIVGPLCFGGVAVLTLGFRWLIRALARRPRTFQIVRSITILRPRHELYTFLRDLENLRVVEADPGRLISWRIADEAVHLDTTVSLRDADRGQGTQLTVVLHGVGRGAELRLAADLIRLRQILETGEIATGKRRRDFASLPAQEPRRERRRVNGRPAGAEGRA